MHAILSSLLFADALPPALPSGFLQNKPLLIGTGVGAGLFFLLVIVWFRRGKKKGGPEASLASGSGATARGGEWQPAAWWSAVSQAGCVGGGGTGRQEAHR